MPQAIRGSSQSPSLKRRPRFWVTELVQENGRVFWPKIRFFYEARDKTEAISRNLSLIKTYRRVRRTNSFRARPSPFAHRHRDSGVHARGPDHGFDVLLPLLI